jgi:hypothetical protein
VGTAAPSATRFSNVRVCREVMELIVASRCQCPLLIFGA